MEKLKISDVRKKINFHISEETTMHYLYKIAEGAYNTTVDFDVYLPSIGKNLQRDFVWTKEQKSELIISVLKGITLNSLAIILDKGPRMDSPTVMRIIDGKQRLSTMLDFYKGLFSISVKGNEYFYEDLEEDAQRLIKYYSFRARTAYEYTQENEPIADEEKIAWFEMINFAGTPQDAQHLENLKK